MPLSPARRQAEGGVVPFQSPSIHEPTRHGSACLHACSLPRSIVSSLRDDLLSQAGFWWHRSRMLVSPSTRAALERNRLDMLAQARRSTRAKNPRVPLCRDQIIAAEDAVRAMLDALVVHRPVSRRRRPGELVARRRCGSAVQPAQCRRSPNSTSGSHGASRLISLVGWTGDLGAFDLTLEDIAATSVL